MERKRTKRTIRVRNPVNQATSKKALRTMPMRIRQRTRVAKMTMMVKARKRKQRTMKLNQGLVHPHQKVPYCLHNGLNVISANTTRLKGSSRIISIAKESRVRKMKKIHQMKPMKKKKKTHQITQQMQTLI